MSIVHPDMGRLLLNYEVLLLPDEVDQQRLITWLPADDATATALARTGATSVPRSPAQLRVIGSNAKPEAAEAANEVGIVSDSPLGSLVPISWGNRRRS